MTTLLTEEGRKKLLEGFGKKGPFFRDKNGTSYIRFNQIRIRNFNGAISGKRGVRIDFLWKGDPIVYSIVENIKIENDSYLDIVGFDGRQEVAYSYPIDPTMFPED